MFFSCGSEGVDDKRKNGGEGKIIGDEGSSFRFGLLVFEINLVVKEGLDEWLSGICSMISFLFIRVNRVKWVDSFRFL